MSFQPTTIGVVRTNAEDLPRHWSVSNVEGILEIKPEYAEGLRDIEPGQHIVVLFHFDRSEPFAPEFLIQMSGGAGSERGVFSTCSPIRPTPSGLSVLEVTGIDGPRIAVRGLDMFDGTPILDIKPHIEIPAT